MFERTRTIYIDETAGHRASEKRATSLAISWGEYRNLGFVYVTVSSEMGAIDERGVDFRVI